MLKALIAGTIAGTIAGIVMNLMLVGGFPSAPLLTMVLTASAAFAVAFFVSKRTRWHSEHSVDPIPRWVRADLYGHQQFWGRAREVRMLGIPMLKVNDPRRGIIYIGPRSVFSMTEVTKEDVDRGYVATSPAHSNDFVETEIPNRDDDDVPF